MVKCDVAGLAAEERCMQIQGSCLNIDRRAVSRIEMRSEWYGVTVYVCVYGWDDGLPNGEP